MEKKLCDIYEKVFEEKFEFAREGEGFNKRIKLQKAVYVLENYGLNIGDYSFTWNKFGPYSIALDYDAMVECENRDNVSRPEYSKFAKECFDRLKEIVNQRENYDLTRWIESVASMHYLRFVELLEKEDALRELVKRKDYLNDDQENRRALTIAEEIKAG